MTWASITFKRTGETSKESKERLARLVDRHRPAMQKVIEDVRQLVKDLNEKSKKGLY